MTETLEKHVPIAQKFHKSKPVAEEDLIAPKKVLLPFNTFLLCSQWLVFIIMLVYYSDPVNYVKQSELQIKWNWGKDGDGADSTAYNCTPVQTDEYWGMSSTTTPASSMREPRTLRPLWKKIWKKMVSRTGAGITNHTNSAILI